MRIELTLAWRNLRRNRRRTLLSVGGISFAGALLVFMFSMQVSQYQLMLKAAVSNGTGYMQVQAEGYQKNGYNWLVISKPEAASKTMLAQPRINATTPRSEGFALIASGKHAQGALVIGIDPQRESTVLNTATYVRAGAFLAEADFDEAIIGALLAKNLEVGLGDRVTILGTGRDGSVAAGDVRIKAISETGQPELDRSLLHVPLPYFDEVFRMEGTVHRVLGKADGLWGLDAVAHRLEPQLKGDAIEGHPAVVKTWKDLLPGVLQAIQLDMVIGAAMYLILILVVAFSILNTFIMAVHERTREFGVMMAVGTSPGRLVRVLLIESAFLTTLGALGGMLLGAAVTAYFARAGISFGEDAAAYMRQYGLPPRLHPELSWLSALFGPTAIVLITMVTAFFPAWRVHRLRPVEALRVAG